MKIAFRIAIVPAALWALFLPGAYGLLFTVATDWSAIVDFAIVISCIVLALSSFIRIPSIAWFICFFILSVALLSGVFFHFQDSGESGPLPFEWLNRYFIQGTPLLILSGTQRAWQ